MNPLWFRFLEGWLVTRLLSSPTFHRLVGSAHRRVHNLRHGIPPEEMGGTKLDADPNSLKNFFKFFSEEVQNQIKGTPKK